MRKNLLFMMKSALILIVVFSVFSCSKDDSDSVEMSLVVVKRADGSLYKVDKTTGDLTQIGAITYEEAPLTGLRCLIWDSKTGKAYAGSTNDGGGRLFSINMKTGVATLLNGNDDEDWDAIAGMLVSGDSLLTNMYSNILGNSALTKFSKTSGEYGVHRMIVAGQDEEDDIWSPGGLIYGSNNSQLIIGGDSEVYISDLNGVVSDTISLVPTTNIDDSDVYVMTLAKDNSAVYGLFWEYNDKDQYLVKFDFKTGEITELKFLVNGGNTALYHCLALIPEGELPVAQD